MEAALRQQCVDHLNSLPPPSAKVCRMLQLVLDTLDDKVLHIQVSYCKCVVCSDFIYGWRFPGEKRLCSECFNDHRFIDNACIGRDCSTIYPGWKLTEDEIVGKLTDLVWKPPTYLCSDCTLLKEAADMVEKANALLNDTNTQ